MSLKMDEKKLSDIREGIIRQEKAKQKKAQKRFQARRSIEKILEEKRLNDEFDYLNKL